MLSGEFYRLIICVESLFFMAEIKLLLLSCKYGLAWLNVSFARSSTLTVFYTYHTLNLVMVNLLLLVRL